MNDDNRNASDLEPRLRARLKAATNGITYGSDFDADIQRATRLRRRSRRLTASAVMAAILVVAVPITVSATRGDSRRELVSTAGVSTDGTPTNPSVAPADTLDPPSNPSVPVTPDSVAATAQLPGGISTTLPAAGRPIDTPAAENTLIVSFEADTCATDATTQPDPATLNMVVLRTDRTTGKVNLLAFPPNLLVNADQTKTISEYFSINNPQLLVSQIYVAFGIPINHYVQLNPCAVSALIDAVGGVAVPFATPTRDLRTGLDIVEPGCHTFTGATAATYLTATYLEYINASGDWATDPTSQQGRIWRQFDFVHRLLATGIANGTLARSNTPTLVSSVSPNMVTDANLTNQSLVQLLDIIAAAPAKDLGTYDLSGTSTLTGAGLVIDLSDPNTKEIAALFRGNSTATVAPIEADRGIVPNPATSCL